MKSRSTPEKMVELNNVMVVWELKNSFVHLAILGRCSNNQNGNLRWYLPWRGGGRRLMANTILNFHFDYLHTSLTKRLPLRFLQQSWHRRKKSDIICCYCCCYCWGSFPTWARKKIQGSPMLTAPSPRGQNNRHNQRWPAPFYKQHRR